MVRTTLLTLWFLALSAPLALAADEHDGGEGTWGLTDDKVVTNAGFIIIVGFPILVLAPVAAPVEAREAQGPAPGRRQGAPRPR